MIISTFFGQYLQLILILIKKKVELSNNHWMFRQIGIGVRLVEVQTDEQVFGAFILYEGLMV